MVAGGSYYGPVRGSRYFVVVEFSCQVNWESEVRKLDFV